MNNGYLAAYDPACGSPVGDYWVWSHQAIPRKVRDSFYYTIFGTDLPQNPGEITAEHCIGGYAQIDAEWGCWYRFLNGGRDQLNRPGRYVICCAFVRLGGDPSWDWSGVLTSAPFKELAAVAPTAHPLPSPASLEYDFNPVPVTTRPPLLDALLGGKTIQHDGDTALNLAGQLAAFVPADVPCHCKVRRKNGSTSISFSRIRAPQKQAIAPPPLLSNSAPEPSSSTLVRTTKFVFRLMRRVLRLRTLILVLLALSILLLRALITRSHRDSGSTPLPKLRDQLQNLFGGEK